jgi:hypothetical protein
MNPKASFGNFIAASCGVLYPPLRGIVRLANSDALRFQNWSFTTKNPLFLVGFVLIWILLDSVLVEAAEVD